MIVGAGFGGLAAAKELAGTDLDVTIVDQHNYHGFSPLLYQVATAGLSPDDIAQNVRGIFQRAANVDVRQWPRERRRLRREAGAGSTTVRRSRTTRSSSRPGRSAPTSASRGSPSTRSR